MHHPVPPVKELPEQLRIDVLAHEPHAAIPHREVPAAGVVVENMVALVLARAVLKKFGGDSLPETKANVENYLRAVADREPVQASG